MKKVVFAIIAVCAVWSLSSCAKEKKTVIAVIPKGTTHVFWKSVHAGAVKASRETGVEIVWQGPQKEDDRTMQIEVVQNFISRAVAAIVLAPLDEVALARPVETAVNKNVKVVIIDSELKSDSYSSFVATDNYVGGKMGAKRLAELVGGKGNVLLMRYAEGSASTAKREQGFLDGIKEYAPELVMVSSDQYGGVTVESALQAGQNLLNKYPDLQGIFCPNESTTFGMLRALETAKKAGAIKFVGFDASEPLLTALKNDEINGLVVQNPFRMGYLGVKTAVAAIKGEQVEKRVDTGAQLVTKETLTDPEIMDAIAPDLKTWLGNEQ